MSMKTKVYLIAAIILVVIITVIALAYIFYVLNLKPNIKTDNNILVSPTVESSLAIPTSSITPTPKQTVIKVDAPVFQTNINLSEYNIFYDKEDGIYAYNVTTKQSIKIINDAMVNFYLGGNKIIIKQYYSDSNYSTDSDVYYLVDLSTHTIVHIKTLSGDVLSTYYRWVGFFDESNLIITRDNIIKTGDYTEYLLLENNSATIELGPIGIIYGRGAFYSGDSSRFILSPDGKNYIYTLGFLVKSDSTEETKSIFVINKDTKSYLTIENAKMPLWIDSANILYQSIDDNKLHVFNITNSTSSNYTKMAVDMSDKFGLHMNGNKFIYWKADQKAYLYDTVTHIETKILDKATEANFYNSDLIIYSKLVTDLETPGGVNANNLWLYNITNGTEVQVNDSNTYIMKTDRGIYYCESILCAD